MRCVHCGLAAADDINRLVASTHFFAKQVERIWRNRSHISTGKWQRGILRDLKTKRLDATPRLDLHALAALIALRTLDEHGVRSVGFFHFTVRQVEAAITLFELDLGLQGLQAMIEMVENFRSIRQMRRCASRLPGDISGSEHAVRLVQADVIVGLVPHPARFRIAVDKNHFVVGLQIATRGIQGIHPGDAGTDDTQLTRLHT